MFQRLFSSVISVPVILALAVPQGCAPSAQADDQGAARFYVRLPFGEAPEDKARVGFSLNFQPDERVVAPDLNLQLPAIQLELSSDGVEHARLFGFDAKLAYDYAYGYKDAGGGADALPTLLLYSLAGGVAGALLTACLVEWCTDDDNNAVVTNMPSTPVAPPVVIDPTVPVTPVTPAPPVTNPTNPTMPTTPVTAA